MNLKLNLFLLTCSIIFNQASSMETDIEIRSPFPIITFSGQLPILIKPPESIPSEKERAKWEKLYNLWLEAKQLPTKKQLKKYNKWVREIGEGSCKAKKLPDLAQIKIYYQYAKYLQQHSENATLPDRQEIKKINKWIKKHGQEFGLKEYIMPETVLGTIKLIFMLKLIKIGNNCLDMISDLDTFDKEVTSGSMVQPKKMLPFLNTWEW